MRFSVLGEESNLDRCYFSRDLLGDPLPRARRGNYRTAGYAEKDKIMLNVQRDRRGIIKQRDRNEQRALMVPTKYSFGRVDV